MFGNEIINGRLIFLVEYQGDYTFCIEVATVLREYSACSMPLMDLKSEMPTERQ